MVLVGRAIHEIGVEIKLCEQGKHPLLAHIISLLFISSFLVFSLSIG